VEGLVADAIGTRTDGGTRQQRQSLGVEIVSENDGDELRDPVAVERLVAHEEPS
jgi:hypothetical protein